MAPISEPSSRIEPALGRIAPAIRLKIVLLPEPFGPIRPRISPLWSSKETRFTARNPSKLLVRDSTTSTRGPRCFASSRALAPLQGEGERTAAIRLRSASSHGVRRGGRQRQHWVGGADGSGPHHLGAVLHVLHDHGRGALVLARHRCAGREEFHAVALDGTAGRNVDVERR